MARHTTRVSDAPHHAPANFRELPAKVVTKDGDGLFGASHGSGVPTSAVCVACGNTEGNLQIYSNWGYSYPNGDSWDDEEIVCGACGKFSSHYEFTEG